MSFNDKQTIFTGTQLDYEEIVEIPEGYEKAELKDFEDGTLITGRPEMSSVNYSFSKMMKNCMLKSMSTSKTMETFTKTSGKEACYLTLSHPFLNWKMQVQ
ncbi:hypothetical protein [uncultured Methanobrevibacter sp.]|uniref:hypothetical protein n=1 Tax=uncultured Methanobrevibacter sp. TaxID=253161 RepID=UPI0025DC022D|nr:hypothetical protein [uncultured Methanobrevibacter sp.]